VTLCIVKDGYRDRRLLFWQRVTVSVVFQLATKLSIIRA